MSDNSTSLRERTDSFYVDVDTDDPAVFPRHLDATSTFHFNSAPPVVGVDSIRQAVEAWKDNFSTVRHEVTGVIVDSQLGQVGVELTVTYTAHDGQQTVVKGASFLTLGDEVIQQWRVYVDTSGLT